MATAGCQQANALGLGYMTLNVKYQETCKSSQAEKTLGYNIQAYSRMTEVGYIFNSLAQIMPVNCLLHRLPRCHLSSPAQAKCLNLFYCQEEITQVQQSNCIFLTFANACSLYVYSNKRFLNWSLNLQSIPRQISKRY